MQTIRTGVTRLRERPTTRSVKKPCPALDAPIEDGIPIPEMRARRALWKEKLNSMKVGQSFLIETEYEAESVREAISHLKKNHAEFQIRRYTIRRLDMTTTWRCWRLQDAAPPG